MKKNYFIILFAAGLLIFSGCTAKNQAENNPGRPDSDPQVNQDQRPNWNENFEEAGIDDLAAGQQVLIMGTEDDGGITARRIMVGNGETNFDEMAPMQIRAGAEGRVAGSSNQDFQRPEGMPDFQNMSDEERAKFREQMTAQRGGEMPARTGNFQSHDAGQTMSRLIGEIIAKDDESVTVKLKEGGSKFIFFSDSTAVLRIK